MFRHFCEACCHCKLEMVVQLGCRVDKNPCQQCKQQVRSNVCWQDFRSHGAGHVIVMYDRVGQVGRGQAQWIIMLRGAQKQKQRKQEPQAGC